MKHRAGWVEKFVVNNIWLKLASLAIAILLWWAVTAQGR